MVKLVQICVIGDGKTGKSQLVLNFADQLFGTHPRFDNFEKDLDIYGQNVRVRVYDAPCEFYIVFRRLCVFRICFVILQEKTYIFYTSATLILLCTRKVDGTGIYQEFQNF